ncbi:MAG: YlxR family protein [Ilumatobacteraceae bacterium]
MTTPDTRIAAPQRTCIGCRQSRPQDELVRCTISSTAGGSQGAQVSRTAAGRGAWLCSLSCYQTAVQRKAFDRSWKQSVSAETVLALGDSLRASFNRDMKEWSVVGNAPDSQTSTKG